MNYMETAKLLGFSDAAIMNTRDLVFKPEYRKFCEENRCWLLQCKSCVPAKERNCERNDAGSFEISKNPCSSDNPG